MTHGVVAVGLSDQMRHAGHDVIGADLKSVADRMTARLGGQVTATRIATAD
jgi:hypothetical protein